jgi:hypothetical protein
MFRKNPSEWRVTHQYAGSELYIRVYRLIDKNAADHGGNREYLREIYETDAEAKAVADELNSYAKENRP